MNKNDKFRSAEFDVNAQAISDEELDAVSGGASVDLEGYKKQGKAEWWCNTCKAHTWHVKYENFTAQSRILICQICGSSRSGG